MQLSHSTGKVQVFRRPPHDKTVVADLGTGEYFGEMALLEGVQHTSSARAVTSLDLIVMSGSDFAMLTNTSTHFNKLVADVARQRLADKDVESGTEGIA